MEKYGGGRASCERKIRYETKKQALAAAKSFRKKHGPKLRPYPCHREGETTHWHNGHDRSKRFYAGKYRLPTGMPSEKVAQ